MLTALAVVRFMQEATGMSLKKVVPRLRPLHELLGEIVGHEFVCPPDVPPQTAELVSNVENFGPGCIEAASGSARGVKRCVTSRHRGH